MEPSITKQLIFSYLSGQATPIEIQLVDEWLKDPANSGEFYGYVLLWERAHAQFTPDHERAIEKFWQREVNPETVGDETHSRVGEYISDAPVRPGYYRRLTKILSVAACFLALTAGGWLMREEIVYKTIRTNYGEISRHTLPDGSQVVLNSNSSLRLSRFGFNNDIRQVWLNGEAEFSVVHTETDQRFIVKTPTDFQVEVLGTEFSLFTRERGTKVVLNSGRIRVDYKKHGQATQLLMKPGDLLTLDHVGEIQLQKTDTPEEHSAWKEHRFVFDATPVGEICQLLAENFGIIVHPSTAEIANRTITGNFKTQTSEELLGILREVFSLETIKKQDTLVLFQR